MKRLLIALTLFASLQSLALTKDEFCKKFNKNKDVNKCFSALKNGVFQEEALLVCHNHMNITSAVKCLKIIENNTYDNAALSICDMYKGATAVNECLSYL